MHKAYLEEEHPGLYERLILNGTLHTHLADANERAEAMMELLTEQMKKREGITERLKSRTAYGLDRQDEQYPLPG